jgi:2-polyprenyl-3-methyl-5-hydroxy-6-metoxy-1,4-benzoquinol methylase
MSGRYYEAEHFAAYERIRREGLSQRNDLHTSERTRGYENFEGRDFLDRVLPSGDQARRRRVLKYGCGTGAAACFLAQRGFQVDAVDLVPDAIVVARRFAAEHGLEIHYAVQDIAGGQTSPSASTT